MNREDWSDKNVAQKGFTLIELLVVVAILGILAVVGVLAFGGLTDGAKTAVNETEKAEIQTAAKAYKAVNGVYPANQALLTGGTNPLVDGTIKCTYTYSTTALPAQTTCTPAP